MYYIYLYIKITMNMYVCVYVYMYVDFRASSAWSSCSCHFKDSLHSSQMKEL